MNLPRRLDTLERYWPRPVCPNCHGYPSRLVGIDEETGKETSESMPTSGCPACKRPIARELHIVGVPADAP